MESNRLYEQSLISLGWPELIEALCRQTAFSMTAERCRALPFLDRPETVRERLATISEGVELLKGGSPIPLDAFADPRPALTRATKGAVLEGIELRGIHDLLDQSEAVRAFLTQKREEAPRLFRQALLLEPMEGLRSRIASAIDPEGRILEGATPALRALTAEANQAREALTGQLDRMLRSSRYEALLQEPYYTERDGRYVLPFKVAHQNKEGGVVHDLSASGATAFVEPRELVGPNNRLRVAQLAVAREVERILRSLSEEVGREAERLQQTLQALIELDLLRAAARLTEKIGATSPEITGEAGPIRLWEARHPLLLLRKGAVIPNDIVIDEEKRALILSGPNTGGKTVLLKTIGLLALMVRAGLPIPCREGSEIPLFPSVMADIGDDQDLSRDLSSFSAHLQKIVTIFEAAPRGSLVLLDEMVTSTDPAEGAALAAAVLVALVDRGMRIVTTTHYPSLKGLAQSDPRFLNGSLAFDLARLAPTYRLILGTPGRSAALEIASRLGLPAALLDQARARLQPEEEAMGRMLAELERERRTAEEAREKWQRLREEAETAAIAQKEGAARWMLSEKEIQKRVRQRVAEAVAEARSEIDALMASLRGKTDATLIKKGRGVLETIAQKVGEQMTPASPAAARPLQVGKPVEILSLGKKGILLDPPGASKRVRVQVEQQILSVSPEVLQGAEEASGAPAAAPASYEKSAGATGRTLDLIGQRVEEALVLLERFLDQAMLSGEREVRLVHGHGSGRLKKAIREFLSVSPYIGHFRPGEMVEGGDAVTIATLRDA